MVLAGLARRRRCSRKASCFRRSSQPATPRAAAFRAELLDTNTASCAALPQYSIAPTEAGLAATSEKALALAEA